MSNLSYVGRFFPPYIPAILGFTATSRVLTHNPNITRSFFFRFTHSMRQPGGNTSVRTPPWRVPHEQDDMKITQYIHNNQQQTTTHFRLLHSPNSRGIQIQTHVESTNPFTTTAHTEGLNDWRGPNFLAHQFLQRPAECHRSWSNRTDGSVRKQETNKMAIKTSNNGDTYFSKRWDRNWVVHPLFIFFR